MSAGDREARGLIPRAAESLFASISAESQRGGGSPAARFTVFASFLDIYLEQIRDLGASGGGGSGKPRLSPQTSSSSYASSDPTNLELYEDAAGLTLVKGLTLVEVASAADVLSLLKAGFAARQPASGAVGDVSARSHTVFTLSVVQYREGHQPITGTCGKVLGWKVRRCDGANNEFVGEVSGVSDSVLRASSSPQSPSPSPPLPLPSSPSSPLLPLPSPPLFPLPLPPTRASPQLHGPGTFANWVFSPSLCMTV